MRAVRREYSGRIRSATARQVINLALRLRETAVHRFVGDELIANHKAAMAALRAADLERLGHGLDTWYQVDCFATILAGPAWRERQVPDEAFFGWAQASDRWWRRAALASTVALNVRARGGAGDAPRTLAVCELLVNDRDDMVVKAMSWALRALSSHEPEAVRAFLAEHGDALAPRVRREVRHKLVTGLKNPRRP
jgi:3-methyladenine DNA glycosylase AlkD